MASLASSSNDSRKRKGSPAVREDALSGVIRWEVDKDSISIVNAYSPAIEVGGIPWRMGTRVNGAYLQVLLYRMEGEYKVTSMDLDITYKLINHEINSSSFKRQCSKKFVSAVQSWGIANFIKWESAFDEDEDFIKDNKLTFQVEFSLSDVKGFSKPQRIDFTNPNEPTNDITLAIDGEKVYVSKPYLSIHSPVFHAMFYGEFVEKDKKEIKLKEIDFKEFVELLHVIYPPYKKITEDNFEHLLKFSDRFGINVVINQCEQHLIASGKSTAEKLVFAGRYRLAQLQELCFSKLRSTKEVKDLKKSNSYKDFTDEIHRALYDKIMDLPD